MDFNKFLMPKSEGNKSITTTVFVLGTVVVNLKLILSGMTIGDFELSIFSGTEYAAAMAALGAIYVLRRSTEKPGSNDNA